MTDMGKTDMGKTSRRLDIDIDGARRLYESGLSLRQVAAEFGVTMPTIIDRFKEAGIERRPGGAPPKVIDIARARQLYEKGVSLKETAVECGVTASTIETDLLAAGVELRQSKSSWIDQFKIRRAAELRRAGGSYREIAAAIGRGNATARAYCFRAGVTVRPASLPPPGHRRLEIDLDRAVALYRSGMTLKQVGAEFGVTWTTVQRRFKEAGVEMRPRGRRRRADSMNSARVRDLQSIRADRAARLYADGETLAQVAIELGVTVPQARALIVSRGVRIRPPGFNHQAG